jgi:hypothetical protein
MATISYSMHNLASATGLWYEREAYEIINAEYLPKLSTEMGLKICPFEVAISATDVRVEQLFEYHSAAQILCTLQINFFFVKNLFLANFDENTKKIILDKTINLWDYASLSEADYLENRVYEYTENCFPQFDKELTLEYFEQNLKFNTFGLEDKLHDRFLKSCFANTNIDSIFYNEETKKYYFHNFIDVSKDFRKIPQIRKIKL